MDYKNWFLTYGEYCATLPKTTQLLDTQVSVDETIAEEVSKCEKAAGKFKLVDLLTVHCIINVSEVSL